MRKKSKFGKKKTLKFFNSVKLCKSYNNDDGDDLCHVGDVKVHGQ